MREDFEIINLVRLGQNEKFALVVERYQKILLRVSYRILGDMGRAEDAVQESFIKAFQKLESFEGRSSFKTWLVQIAVNTSKNKRRERREEELTEQMAEASVEATAETDMSQEDLKGIVGEEVQRLPEKQRMALWLRIFEDLSFKEIAAVMECPYDTAKANYRHGLLKLKDRLVDQNILRKNGFLPLEKLKVPVSWEVDA